MGARIAVMRGLGGGGEMRRFSFLFLLSRVLGFLMSVPELGEGDSRAYRRERERERGVKLKRKMERRK